MNVFELYAKLGLDDSEYNKKLTGAGGTLKSFGESASKMAATAAKVVGASVAVAATAVATLTTNAVKNYAQYEQLVGGVETLFGAGGQSLEEYAETVGKSVEEARGDYDKLMDAQATVLKNSKEAFRTAGLSANAYMETVTSFSASLIQSVGGDTEKAASIADKAIIDMSDNANKMGTSMEAIQNAYQGFAKQNYTMLDNLKLGYGGTKSEMERLVEDAEKLDSSFKAQRDENGKLTLSFADVVEAIHVVQNNIGITGTTAKEASTTIEGSVNSMKAAWQNLVTGIADENADFDKLVENLVTTIAGNENGEGGVINNILPRIEQGLKGVGKLVTGLAPVIEEALPDLISSTLPSLLEAAVSMVTAIGTGIVNSLPAIGSSILSAINTLLDSLGLGDTVRTFIDNLSGPVSESLANIKDTAAEAFERIKTVMEPVIETVKNLYDRFMEWINSGDAFDDISNVFSEGITLIGDAISKVIDFTATVIEKIGEFIGWLKSGNDDAEAFKTTVIALAAGIGTFMIITEVVSLFNTLKTSVAAVKGVFTAFNAVLAANPIGLLIAAIAALVAVIVYLWNTNEDFRNFVIETWGKIKDWIHEKVEKIKESFETLKTDFGLVRDWFSEKIDDIKTFFESLKESFGLVKDWFSEKIDDIKKAWTDLKDNFQQIGDKIKGIWDEIVGAVKTKIDTMKENVEEKFNTVKSFIEGIIDSIKSIFNFDWNLPHLKLPHIEYSIVNVPVLGDIPDPRTLHVEWYKKAYDNPYMFTKPTVMGFGDGVGGEIVYGHNNLMNDIKKAFREAQMSAASAEPITIVVQSVLDGKIIGESVTQYQRGKVRATG